MNKNTFDIGSNAAIVKPIIFRLTKKNESPATEGRYYPGVRRIPSEDTIYDPDKNATRTIRYSINEESIYKSEQSPHVELTDIIFTNGSLKVWEDNPTLLEFLRLCNWNKGNPHKLKGKHPIFYEYDPESVAAELIENEEMEIEARHQAKSMEFDELSTLALAVGMNVNRSAKEIRHDMMQFAKRSPREFLEAMDSPVLKRRAEVLEAIELGILKKEQRAMYLKETLGDVSLLVIPVSVEPVDHFVAWTLNDAEGEEAWNKVTKKRKKLLD
jgi:hypothetical protein